MVVTHKLRMDLEGKGPLQWIEMVQGDVYTRNVTMLLFCGQKEWNIPEGVSVLIRFRKPDGVCGEYDTLPDGTAAWSAEGNALRFEIVPQVLTTAGTVMLSVSIALENKIINTFAMEIRVREPLPKQEDAGAADGRREISKEYFYVTGILPVPEKAEVGQYLRVSAVDEKGKATRTEAVSIQSCTDISEEAVKEIVDTYLQENPPVGGESGRDGFSPLAVATQTDSGAIISITDVNGTTEVTLSNGKDGTFDYGTLEANLPYRLQSYQNSGNCKLTNPDDAKETGFYYISGENNRPPFGHTTKDYRLLVTSCGPNDSQWWLQQIATDFRCDKIFFRRCEGTVWTPWVRFAMESDIENILSQMPVKGTDYWTDSDKEEIIQEVISALGTPVFGMVDTENNIILSGNLAQGSYTLKYENEDGSLTVIGTLDRGGYTNQIPISTDTDGSIYNGTGYRTGSRCGSSGAVSDVENSSAEKAPFLTGFIPCKIGDRIVLENCYMQAYNGDSASELGTLYGSSGYSLRSAFYDSAKAKISLFSWGNLYDNDAHSISHTQTPGTEFKLTEFTVVEGSASFIRLCLATDGSPADAVVKIIH